MPSTRVLAPFSAGFGPLRGHRSRSMAFGRLSLVWVGRTTDQRLHSSSPQVRTTRATASSGSSKQRRSPASVRSENRPPRRRRSEPPAPAGLMLLLVVWTTYRWCGSVGSSVELPSLKAPSVAKHRGDALAARARVGKAGEARRHRGLLDPKCPGHRNERPRRQYSDPTHLTASC